MKLGTVIGGGASVLALAWGINAVSKSGLPEGCFRSNADRNIYLVEDGVPTLANNRWRMNDAGTNCFIPDSSTGASAIIPVVQFP